ncbi:NAD(P)/FAD-dependent oxidoreductase [Rhodospirillum sp. A1_3_36]|uniref:flavin-dependent monooxygenase QhpG n=1 Tax=Rhodospirillum sp. A1_3_36 TaxID=3391666 RepID=UPI0039A72B06
MIADLVVLGGGPAGAVAARLASTRGAHVILVDPDRTPERLEGLSERLLGWLRSQGLDSHLPEDSPFVPRKALWAGRESAHNGEYLVERASLDRNLRTAAKDAGAKVVTASGTVDRLGPGPDVNVILSDGRQILTSRILDARGRKAHGKRPVTRGPATLAIGSWFKDRSDAAPEARILPFPEGWLWIARPGGGRLWVQATLDAREGDGASPATRLHDALESASRVGALPDGGPGGWPNGGSETTPLGDPLVRDCAPVLPTDSIDLRQIPAGDAAAGMDPLSGNGMFWAVSGALAAFAVLETLAARPGPDSEALSRRYLEERIRETYLRQARLGRDFLLQETRYAEYPFWARRRSFPDSLPLHGPEEPPTGSITIKRTIVVEKGLLVERDILVTDQEPSGVAWLADIPAVEAYHMLQTGAGEDALAWRWGPEATRAAMAWFRARGLAPLRAE